jgi:tmRNA-binding protein
VKHFNKESRDYEFIAKFEAGIALTGSDAKSLRVQNGKPILSNLKIPLYK